MTIAEEYRVLLALFHGIIDSVTLQPITPVAPEQMPPFVLWRPTPVNSEEQNP